MEKGLTLAMKNTIKYAWNLIQREFENEFYNCIWKENKKGSKEASKGIFYEKSLWQINKHL